MTIKEFHEILRKPDAECNGYDLHIRHLWNHNRTKQLFEITGLDLSNILGPDQPELIKNPTQHGKNELRN